MDYTPEQQAVIRYGGNEVVIAKPGSGKTATLAQIVRNRLVLLPDHRGVIAISYTNKASAELRARSLLGSVDKKSSFFGTIDRFFISQIVVPFGRHLWGKPTDDVTVSTRNELSLELDFLDDLPEEIEEADLEAVLPSLADLYRRGFILLETVGYLACYLFTYSAACKRYMKARYTDLIIDEYQDCGVWQHEFFMLAANTGLRAIAVGDLDQSIYQFAKKRAKYLQALRDDPRFRHFYLTLNHRSHPSIAQYAARFISVEHVIPAGLEPRVLEKTVDGSERDIGEWLNHAVPAAAKIFNTRTRNQIAILVKGHRTAQLVQSALTIPYKYSINTALDNDSSPTAAFYRNILQWIYDPHASRRGFVDEHLPPETRGAVVRKITALLAGLRVAAANDELAVHIGDFVELASIVTGRMPKKRVTDRLETVIESESELDSFIAPYSGQVQIMTIHKAKSLEFDVVFHLDLYKYIFPLYKATQEQLEQDNNLHYVGLTRAKQACVVCNSTFRHNRDNNQVEAQPSPYLYRNNLDIYRLPAPF